ncbi:hypothetical protein AJ80_05650 [Polytolypa hystricis UAMH7299]|uniref:Uncharacterized protein n=1 Tax=Polytolypa hystricis (strain UAMH7299) TaxID=1447883 RepID=A0A2B7Y1I8_POLH7|nr:hypothetical protein AJ80_05650 [Polytolypa hystricis UAMH7299]
MAYRGDPNADPKEDGHIIGAPISRSPYSVLILILLASIIWHDQLFWPPSKKFEEITDKEKLDFVANISRYVEKDDMRKPFALAVDNRG